MTPKTRLSSSAIALVTATAAMWSVLGSTTLPASGQAPAVEIHSVERGTPRPPKFEEPIFILMLGGDARSGNPTTTRMDAIQIIGIDPVSGAASILGVPRDAYVEISGYGSNKITAAGIFGGPELMIETLEQRSGCRFDYWALTNFPGFRGLINDIGGVEMNIRERLSESRGSRIDLQPGVQTLDGTQALAFTRLRKTSARPLGDISRSAAQGELLVAMLAELRRDFRSTPGSILRALGAVRRHFALDISLADTLRLGQAVLQIDPMNVTRSVVDGELAMAGAASIVRITERGSEQFVDICSDGILGS